MEYRTHDGKIKTLGQFGRSTHKEFDEALAVLPELVKMGRAGNEQAGQTANVLLWALANESFSSRRFSAETWSTLHLFGKPEAVTA